MNPLHSPWQGDILPMNYRRKSLSVSRTVPRSNTLNSLNSTANEIETLYSQLKILNRHFTPNTLYFTYHDLPQGFYSSFTNYCFTIFSWRCHLLLRSYERKHPVHIPKIHAKRVYQTNGDNSHNCTHNGTPRKLEVVSIP